MVAEGRKILRNLQRVTKLFVTKSAFAAFLILSIGLTPTAYPLLPRHLTLAATLTIGIPAFFLALAPSDGPWRTRGLPARRRALRRARPGRRGPRRARELPLRAQRRSTMRARRGRGRSRTTVLVIVGLYLDPRARGVRRTPRRLASAALRRCCCSSTLLVLALRGDARLLRARRAARAGWLVAILGAALAIGWPLAHGRPLRARPGGRGLACTMVAVTAQPKLDADTDPRRLPDLRASCPRQAARVPRLGRELAEAAPDARRDDATFYETSYANVHRGVYRLAERATEALEAAREKVRALLNAPTAREIVFTRNATEALNLVAYAWGLEQPRPRRPRRRHRARAPLELRALAVHRAAGPAPSFRMIPLDDHGELGWTALDEIAREGNVKVVATGLVSNSLGTVNPIERLAAWAHEQGAIMVVDAAQAAPHRRSTSRRSAPTSSRSRRTRCAARAASARSGAGRAARARWSRSSPAAT